MPKYIRTAIVAGAVVVASTGAGRALADDSTNDAVAVAPRAAPQNPLGAKPIDTRALANQRGGTDAGTLSDLKLNGVVGNNSASNLSTGNNAITDGAFAGVNGVPLVVQNSGNNVLIQNATIINVQVK